MTADTAPIPASLDVTLSVPFDQLIHAYTQRPGPCSGDPDDFEEAPPVVLDVIGERVAQILAKEQRDEVRELVRASLAASIRAQVEEVVRDAVTTSIQPTDPWGQPKSGAPTTLRELIAKEAHDWMHKETGDYNRRRTMLQKYVGDEVDRAVKADLDEALKAARAEVTQQIKQKAAEAITATVTSIARGL